MPDDVITIESLLDKGSELSSLPEVYLRVTQQLEDENSSAKIIGDTVQTDPALSTRILKMVNSAYYGMPNQVSTISQAVQLLGRDRLKQILIGSVLVNVFRDPEINAFSLTDFWMHSIKTAIIARQLASQLVDIDEADSIFIAGLLHDLGRLLLASKLPLEYEKIEGRKRSQDLLETERKVLGFDHAELAASLMTRWRLPDILLTCARHHHNSEYAGIYANENRVIYVANKLSRNIPPMDEGEAQEQLIKVNNWQLLGLSLDQICIACQLADEQMFDVMESLGMINIELESA